MTAITEHPAPLGSPAPVSGPPTPVLGRAAGAQLCGEVRGSGYKNGAAMVRRADGQMVKLGPLMYSLLECIDGQRDLDHLAAAVSQRIRRQVNTEQVTVLAGKLAAAGLLAGSEHLAPPRRNPLLALRWKVLVTNRSVTRWVTAPFVFLFRPLVMWPVLMGFVAVLWYVLVHKGLASATAQAFDNPGLLLLVFALMVGSAAFHELGHAAACRYAGATPGGMGMGLYLVWSAFYTDVTDTYRLPRRDRLRVDLGGLYFNAIVAVATMVVWLAWRKDALLLLVGLQILLMVKQLSPVIRADGYHILADATGVPDLYSHIGPTLRSLLPWRREPSALTGWARALVTLWVLVLVPVILSLLATAVLLLPRLATTAWDSGHHIAEAIPTLAHHGQWVSVGASLVRLVALLIPLAGSALVTQKVARSLGARAWAWSSGHVARRLLCLLVAAAVAVGLAWAWWPSGQYQRIAPHDHGTVGRIPALLNPLASATAAPGAHPGLPLSAVPLARYPVSGAHASGIPVPTPRLALVAIPAHGASKADPAYFFLPGTKSQPATAIVAFPTSAGHEQITPVPASEFLFNLTSSTAEGPHTHAFAINNANNGVLYQVAYSLVTVYGGLPVTGTNHALAVADCQNCTTVAVSFQVILIVGQSGIIDPLNTAEALNYHCLACVTTAVADQIVVTLKSQPTPQLLGQLEATLSRLGRLSSLGSGGTPAAVAAQAVAVQQQLEAQLNASGLVSPSPSPTSTLPSAAVPSSIAPAPSSTNTSTTAAAPTTDVPATSAATPATTSSPTTALPVTSSSTPPTTTPPTSSPATPATATPATTNPPTSTAPVPGTSPPSTT